MSNQARVNIIKTVRGVQIVAPIVHVGGTGQELLVEQFTNGRRAIRKTMKVLAAGCPHSRDYAVQAREAWNRAQSEHRTRIERLASIDDELLALLEYVSG